MPSPGWREHALLLGWTLASTSLIAQLLTGQLLRFHCPIVLQFLGTKEGQSRDIVKTLPRAEAGGRTSVDLLRLGASHGAEFLRLLSGKEFGIATRLTAAEPRVESALIQ